MGDHLKPSVVLRLATSADEDRVNTLAQLDSAPVPTGEVLIAEVDGRLQAALGLDGGQPIADPFRRTADLVELLQARAGHLRGGATTLSALERRSSHLRSAKPLAALRRLA
jgi:hypothetical protein